MRRNWLTVLLFALAIAVQAFAPAAANVALAKGVRAPGASLELCLTAADTIDGQQQAPSQIKRHRDACPLCQSFCDGVAPLATRLTPLGKAPVLWTALSWTVADRALPIPEPDFSRQARAPPVFS